MFNYGINKLYVWCTDYMIFGGLWNNWVYLGEMLRMENLLSRRLSCEVVV